MRQLDDNREPVSVIAKLCGSCEQQIERGMYKACETVFDGRQNVVGAPFVDRRKERFKSRARDQSNLFAKKFHRSLFAESSRRALESDARAIRRQLQPSFTLFVA